MHGPVLNSLAPTGSSLSCQKHRGTCSGWFNEIYLWGILRSVSSPQKKLCPALHLVCWLSFTLMRSQTVRLCSFSAVWRRHSDTHVAASLFIVSWSFPPSLHLEAHTELILHFWSIFVPQELKVSQIPFILSLYCTNVPVLMYVSKYQHWPEVIYVAKKGCLTYNTLSAFFLEQLSDGKKGRRAC